MWCVIGEVQATPMSYTRAEVNKWTPSPLSSPLSFDQSPKTVRLDSGERRVPVDTCLANEGRLDEDALVGWRLGGVVLDADEDLPARTIGEADAVLGQLGEIGGSACDRPQRLAVELLWPQR
jgi:hypothetical protein